MKIRQALLLGTVGLVATLFTGNLTAQARNLPKSYRGDWYGYVSSEKLGHKKTYYAIKLRFTSKRMDYNFLQTTQANLSRLEWQWGEKSLVSYQRRTNKHHQAYYVLRSQAYQDDLDRLQLKTVKVAGKKTPALHWWGDADSVYAFRQPLRAYAWGWDFEDYIPTDE